jgi:hypothetical protein
MMDKPVGSGKKAYQEPQLRVYGDIRKLTGAVNVAGAAADGMFGSSKSH